MAKRILRRLPVPQGAGSASVTLHKFPEFPMVRAIGLAQSGPGWAQLEHAHDVCEVHLVRCGSGTLTFCGKSYFLKTGDIYAFRPSEPHGGTTNPADPAQVFWLQFVMPQPLQRTVFGALGSKPVFSAEDATELRAALHVLADEVAILRSEELDHTEIEHAPPSVLAKILHVLGALIEPTRKPAVVSGTPRERELAEKLLRRIESGRMTQISLRGVANELNVSPAYLGSSLRAAIGKTFPEIVAELRVRRARQLLADPALPVREVARRVGLASPRALVKLFRRLTGRTPASFRP